MTRYTKVISLNKIDMRERYPAKSLIKSITKNKNIKISVESFISYP